MANIGRFDPFDVSLDPFDDMFKGFFRPVRMENQPQQSSIRMDVRENDQNYVVEAELAGARKEDIHVTIESNQVAISAEVQKTPGKEGEKILRNERYVGKLSRRFALGHEIDEGAAQAAYSNGALALILPKKTASAVKKLDIQ
ncbi:MAG TPA: heat-shock protein Hsp20 [Betaproteobacteria bacterium]|nr:heat-shock protein Hsp20 [Betaproteobacteria bacterium]